MKLAILLLTALNVALLAAWSGVFGPLVGDSRDPDRMARQVRPEQLRVVQAGAVVPPESPQAVPASQAAAADASAATDAVPAPAASSSASLPPATPATPGATGATAPAPVRGAAQASTTAAAPTHAGTSAAPEKTVPVASPPASIPTPAMSACAEWGPFTESDVQGARAAAEQAGARVEPLRRLSGSGTFLVYVPPAADLATAQARAAQLRQAGIDAYVMPDDPYRWGLSLGVFRKEPGAQALLRQLQQRGVADAQVVARGSERWVLRLYSAAALSAERRAALSAAFPGRALRSCAG